MLVAVPAQVPHPFTVAIVEVKSWTTVIVSVSALYAFNSKRLELLMLDPV
jgi:hypothetical protein